VRWAIFPGMEKRKKYCNEHPSANTEISTPIEPDFVASVEQILKSGSERGEACLHQQQRSKDGNDSDR
jgi:hypothetical protein